MFVCLNPFNFKMVAAAFFIFFICSGVSSGVGIYGITMPVSQNCDKGVLTRKHRDACIFKVNDSGKALFYGPVEMAVANKEIRYAWGWDKSYVPYTGMYKLRTHACPASVAENCTLSKSNIFFDSTKSVKLTSDKKIVSQDPDFGSGSGIVGQLPTSSSLCTTLVSPDGTEWSVGARETCQDGAKLPENPAFCYLNMGTDLNVGMGTMERRDISTAPGRTTKKVVPVKVMCTGDANLTAKFSFKYTPIVVTGSEVVSTDKLGLGVAVYFNDKLMSTTDAITQEFTPGVAIVNLGFEVVRDPNVDIGNISTGDFIADAVLILTKQ
ncbi:MAG: hypothetical protein RSG77_05400 [Hafnia sp.]